MACENKRNSRKYDITYNYNIRTSMQNIHLPLTFTKNQHKLGKTKTNLPSLERLQQPR